VVGGLRGAARAGGVALSLASAACQGGTYASLYELWPAPPVLDGGEVLPDGGTLPDPCALADDMVPSCDQGMCRIPAGPFWRGCKEGCDTGCQDNERPGRELTLSAFDIDETEVTEAAYDRSGSSSMPKVNVTWAQADAYCRSIGKRLPTEAEWEKAARGTDGRTYPWGNEPPTCDLATYSGCGYGTNPVGTTPAGTGPYGLKDMAGNVGEWVSDWYNPEYYASAPDVDPKGPTGGSTNRVTRGRGWGGYAAYLRAAFRYYSDPMYADSNCGFRCARTVPSY